MSKKEHPENHFNYGKVINKTVLVSLCCLYVIINNLNPNDEGGLNWWERVEDWKQSQLYEICASLHMLLW